MSQVNMQQVKELRERTQAGMSDCKTALDRGRGDMEKAVEVILKKGLAKSAKRAGAVATEGEVARARRRRRQERRHRRGQHPDRFRRPQRRLPGVRRTSVVGGRAARRQAGADLGAEAFPGGSGTHRRARARRSSASSARTSPCAAGTRSTSTGRAWCTRTCTWAARSACCSRVATGNDAATSAASFDEVRRRHGDADRRDGPALPVDATRSPRTQRQAERDLRGPARRRGQAREAPRPKIIEGKLAKWLKEICLLEQPSVIEADKTVEQLRAGARPRSSAPTSRSRASSASSAARASRSRRRRLRRRSREDGR